MSTTSPDETELACRHDAAEADLLRLAGSGSAQARSLVARNPNAPPEALLALAERFAAEVLANPTLPLLLLEDPGFLDRASPGAKTAIARCPEVTASVLWALARSAQVSSRLAAASSTRAPAAMLAELSAERHVPLRMTIAANPSAPVHVLEALADEPLCAGALVQNPALPPYMARAFARSDKVALRVAAASSPSLPEALLVELCDDGDEAVRAGAARNPQLPPEATSKLRHDPSALVRTSIASHPNTPRRDLVGLSRDESRSVRAAAQARLRALQESPR